MPTFFTFLASPGASVPMLLLLTLLQFALGNHNPNRIGGVGAR
jgi:hypothetical protein